MDERRRPGPIEGGPQEVSTDLEGLEPNKTYQVRLYAENVGGSDTSELPNPTFTTDALGPLVEATAATHVLSASAQINGRIDPRNSHTTYYFQWGSGDCASSPCTSVPASQDADAGSGAAFVYVSAELSGLSPATTYHYRLIAASAAAKPRARTRALAPKRPRSPVPTPEAASRRPFPTVGPMSWSARWTSEAPT